MFLAGVMGCLLIGASTVAAATPAGGAVRIFVVPGNSQGQGTIVVAGAIGDYGKTTKETKKGIGTALLHKGTFQVDLSAIDKKFKTTKPLIQNRTTCSFAFSVTAPVPLMHGTGLYKGISGTLTLTETFAAYGPLYKTGAHKGQCNTSNKATPTAQWGSVTGVGTVKFG